MLSIGNITSKFVEKSNGLRQYLKKTCQLQ